MDQKKTGSFLKKLRNEKGITQEQLAEKFGVAGRTVSRWETGNNMPDLNILIEIAEFYDVDIREIIDGERKSENMNSETKETLQKVADYVDTENERIFKDTISICAMSIAFAVVSFIICALESFEIVSIDDGVKIFLNGFVLITSVAICTCIMQLKLGKKKQKINESDMCAILSMCLGILSVPLVFTLYFWLPTAITSIGIGILALRNKAKRKSFSIIGIMTSAIATVMAIIMIFTGYLL